LIFTVFLFFCAGIARYSREFPSQVFLKTLSSLPRLTAK
jgi:hypothetical protein